MATTTTEADWTLDGMNNPLSVQAALLDRFENDTGTVIVDPNNPASVLMESFASLSSGLIRKFDDEVRPAIYPCRANTATDLYKHLSDHEYVDIFAQPASTTVVMIVDKDYIMNNSVEVSGATYNKMVIPASTQFTVGSHSFGIYYPIEFRSNKDTGRFTVVYDTSVKNPLHNVTTSMLEHEIREYNGLHLVYVKIPVYQFTLTTDVDNIVQGAGFKKTIEYEDKFYSIRCIADVLTNPDHDDEEEDIWESKELDLCVSGQVYDPETPTVVFTPDLEKKTVTVEIPYVYLTKGIIRGSLTTYIYMTEGNITYPIPTDTNEVCTIDMFSMIEDDDVATYAEPFKHMGPLQVIPQGAAVTGGSNGMTLDELRSRVMTNTLTDKTLQTPDDITAYFSNMGYVTTLLRDGVTDRIFVAHSVVTNTSGEVISADEIGTIFDFRDENLSDYQTIVPTSDPNIYTILPSTVYKFDKDKAICYPLTDTERATLDALTPSEQVTEFNNNIYTLSPFHLQVDVSSRYPTTVTYNMTNAELVSQEFIAEREDSGVNCQLSLNATTFEVIKGGLKDYYRLTLRVSRSGLDDIDAVSSDESANGSKNFRAILAFKNDDGAFYYGEAVWQSRTDDFDVFTFDITSDYKFKQANGSHTVSLRIKNNLNEELGEESDFFLTSEVRVILTAKNSLEAMTFVKKGQRYLSTDYSNVISLDDVTSYYALSETKLMLKYGSVVNELDQRINLSYSEAQYKKYGTTKFLTLNSPQYARDVNGDLIIDIGYFRTEDTEVDTTLTSGYTKYYSRSGTGTSATYNKLALTSANFDKIDDVWFFKVNTAYYEKSSDTSKVYIAEEYPKGAMTCITHRVAEQVQLNARTRDNYIGCTWIEDDGTQHVFNRDTEIVDEDGDPIKFNFTDSPTLPRFQVNNAVMSAYGDSVAIGKYELRNVRLSAGLTGLSSPNDIWDRRGKDAYSNCIKAQDALYYLWTNYISAGKEYVLSEDTTFEYGKDYYTKSGSVYTKATVTPGSSISQPNTTYYEIHMLKGLKDVSQVIDATKDVEDADDPTADLKALAGTLILVNNDSSDYDTQAPDISIVNTTAHIARSKLYYCTSATVADNKITASKWVCVGQGASMLSMWNEIQKATASKMTKSFGYIYLGAFHGTSTEGEDVYQTFISYLNMKTLDDGSIVPDFTPFWTNHDGCIPIDCVASDDVDDENLYYAKHVDSTTGLITLNGPLDTEGKSKVSDFTLPTGYESVIRYEPIPGCGWTNRVNKWPWDVTTWHVEQSGTISGMSTASIDPSYYYTEDDEFETEFDNARLTKYCAYNSNQYELDDEGELQIDPDHPRYIQYMIDMVQLDYKLTRTTANKNTNEYPSNVTSILAAHFDNLGAVKNSVFTNTRLFWSPLRSLGVSTFKINADETQDLQLDVTVGFRIHVESGDAKDESLIESVRTKLISLVDEYLAKDVFSLTEVASAAMSEMSETIKQIDVLGINGDPDLQTLTPVNDEVRCHLGHSLTLLDDNITIDSTRSLTLEVVTV